MQQRYLMVNIKWRVLHVYGHSLSARPYHELRPLRHIYAMFYRCWAKVVDGVPALVKHWVDVSCLLFEVRPLRHTGFPDECYLGPSDDGWRGCTKNSCGDNISPWGNPNSASPSRQTNNGVMLFFMLGERHNYIVFNPWPCRPSRCIKASFHIPEKRLNFPTTKDFRMKISMKLVYQYMVIFFIFSPTSNHLHPLQVTKMTMVNSGF